MKQKILLIEDDRIMRENTAELLELAGYTVAVAAHGKEGVEKASSFKPNLIVCDIMMPELDGYGVLFVLSKKPETAAIPFIFLTAKSETTDHRKGMEMGADDYLTKPFEDTELLNAIETRLTKHQQISEAINPEANGIQSFLGKASQLIAIGDLAEDLTPHTYQAGEHLYEEEQYPRYLFYVQEGEIKTYRTNLNGKELITELASTGTFIGYQALLEDRPYAEYAQALVETTVYRIPKESFLSLIYKNRDVATQFIRLISKNLSDKEEQLIQLAYDSVKRRVALQLKTLFATQSDNTLLVSRNDLAALIGTSKETVVRALTDLKSEGVLETDGQNITLINSKKLEELLRFY